MRNASVIVQVLLFVIALTIVWFYVYPAFTMVSEKQDRVSEYDEAIAEAQTANQLLDELLQEIRAIDSADQEALTTYLPESIDPIVVQRDLLAFVQRRDLQMENLSQTSDAELVEEENRYQSEFSISVTGTYDEIKNLLADIESNNYPLHVDTAQLESLGGDSLRTELSFITYAFMSN